MTSHDWFKKHADRLNRIVNEWPQWLKDAGSTTQAKRPTLSHATPTLPEKAEQASFAPPPYRGHVGRLP